MKIISDRKEEELEGSRQASIALHQEGFEQPEFNGNITETEYKIWDCILKGAYLSMPKPKLNDVQTSINYNKQREVTIWYEYYTMIVEDMTQLLEEEGWRLSHIGKGRDKLFCASFVPIKKRSFWK